MKRLLAALAGLCLLAGFELGIKTPAAAQGCGPTNPNCIVPDVTPSTTSNEQAANTKFVQQAIQGQTEITITNPTVGTNTTDGLVLLNPTAAAAGAQQFSPTLRLTGFAWKTNAPAGSQEVDWVINNQSVQAAAAPINVLGFMSQINGGGYVLKMAIDDNGPSGNVTLSLLGGVSAQNVLQVGPTPVSLYYGDSAQTVYGSLVNTPVKFWTNSSLVMTLQASGGLSLGTATDPGAGNLLVNGKMQVGTHSVTLPSGPILVIENSASNPPASPSGTPYLQMVAANSTNMTLQMNAFAQNATLVGMRADTSAASPSIVAAGENMFVFGAYGYDGTNYDLAGAIAFQVQAAVSNTSVSGVLNLRSFNAGTAHYIYMSNTGGWVIQDVNAFSSITLDPGSAGLWVGGKVYMAGLPTVVSGSGDIVCFNSTSGQLSYATTVALCEPSDPAAKIKAADLVPSVALAKLVMLTPGSGSFKPELELGSNQHVWMYADEVCNMDERLCVNDRSDGFKNYDKIGLSAYIVAAVKALKADNDNLRAEVAQLKKAMRL